jgi:pantetheine-phosphate adenylyltransferase
LNEKLNIAVFPGSFDPFTIGHESIVNRALPFFDSIIIAIGVNNSKNCLFSLEKRISIIEKVFHENSKISVKSYSELTVNFCKENNSKVIIRGLRTVLDFEIEQTIAHANKNIQKEIETFFLLTLPEHSFISSTVFRDLYEYSADFSKLLPSNISINDLK